MSTIATTGLRSVELDVTDLNASAQYYETIWGLSGVSEAEDRLYLRGRGSEHHIVVLHERRKAALHAISFSAADKTSVAALHERALGFGAKILQDPAPLPAEAGGGFGFEVETPEGHRLSISCDLASHEPIEDDPSLPVCLTHIVMNSAKPDAETDFYSDVLGFKLADSNGHIDFIRCCRVHHQIGIAKSKGASVNHMAFEMEDFDALMRGCGRLKANGVDLEWGIGRHGPGNSIFSYFIEPNGFVTEYATEMEIIEDDENHVPGTAEYWRSQPILRPCRWGMAMQQSDILKRAMSGQLVEDRNALCDEIICQQKAN